MLMFEKVIYSSFSYCLYSAGHVNGRVIFSCDRMLSKTNKVYLKVIQKGLHVCLISMRQ